MILRITVWALVYVVCGRILCSLVISAIEFKYMLKFNTEITTWSYGVLLKDMYSLTENTHLRLCAFYFIHD
jgi:hypothetical protein